MAQIQKLIQENQKLKYQLEKFKSSNGLLPYVDDSCFKGGYRVVKTITDRDNIDCCHSKQGMIVCVIGEDLSFKEYRLISDCKNKQWEEIQTQVTENDVILVEDYSELEENLTTQKELNLVLKQLILNLQTQIDNIELIDEKVQITEATNFAQIGQTQKDFNKNIAEEVASLTDEIDNKQDILLSFDKSILIENDGNIEINVSLFEEYFEQQECELNFEPIQILGVYQDGIKLSSSEYEIILPKKVKIKEYVDENIQIEYTHLKS